MEFSSRSRTPLSCAECRRLKLKCDKKKPCSSCIRRGCASICPNGQMVSKGSRFILADTQQLHEKIDVLIARVRQLESALELSHSLHTSEPHHLLRQELRSIATPLESVDLSERNSKEEELAESVGTLTLDGHGSRYFGLSGASLNLWREGDGEGPDESEFKFKEELATALSDLPPELAHTAHASPVPLLTADGTHLSAWILENCLPPFTEAWSLFENYWEHYAWHFSPFTRTTFVEQVLAPFYHRTHDNGNTPLGHRLSLLFMVMAIGKFMDLTQPFLPSNGMRFYLLSRASLSLDPVFESPTVIALQAMYLMGIYILMSRGLYEPEHAWILSGINTKLALTLGLHHDTKKFHLPQVEVEARQQVLIGVICFEAWQSLSVGRPPSYTFANFAWVLSKVDEATITSRDWTALFIRDCLSKVMEAPKFTSYSAILKLDTTINQYPVPAHFRAINTSEEVDEILSVGKVMERCGMDVLKQVSLLFLHRRFFALALKNSPDDPLKSPFAPSVLACHRTATAFLSEVHNIYSVTPAMALRIWFIWPNVFVSTLIMGSIVARSPGCSLAASALLELEKACQLWEATSESVCSSRVLVTVRTLKQKAFAAFARNRSPNHPLSASAGIDVSDEIAALGGGGPRVRSSSKPNTTFPSSSRPHPHEQATFSIPPVQGAHAGTFPSQVPPRNEEPQLLEGVPPDLPYFPMAQSFDFTGVDLSYQIPDFAINNLSSDSDFDQIFQSMSTTPETQPSVVNGQSILEQFGLGGGWQPVMDDLGL